MERRWARSMTWCEVPSHDGRILARGCLPLSWAPAQQSTPGGGSGATPITLVVVEELVVPSWVVLVAPDGTDVLVDRKSVVWGKSVSVRLDLGGRRLFKQNKKM